MIPIKLRNEMASDPYYQKCCITGIRKGTPKKDGGYYKIEWHHALSFGGRKIQEKECILPVISEVHEQARNILMKEKLDYVMLQRMSKEQITKYSKAVNLAQRLKYLQDKLSP